MMNPFTLLKIAHWSMGLSLSVASGVIYVLYGTRISLGIPTLVFLHIFFIVLATFFKVSYVMRLTALKQLGRPVN